jgi:hydrogenase maturation protease
LVLLIGYGNPGRGDDGLGPALAERIRARDLAGVVVKTDYQLVAEHALDVSRAEHVIFADAQIEGTAPYEFGPAHADTSADVSSHNLSPGAVLALAHLLFDATPGAFTLAMTGARFDRIEEGLSARAARNLDLAEALWRRRWDSNPRYAFTHAGFQDRCIRPLCHSSGPSRTYAHGIDSESRVPNASRRHLT